MTAIDEKELTNAEREMLADLRRNVESKPEPNGFGIAYLGNLTVEGKRRSGLLASLAKKGFYYESDRWWGWVKVATNN